MMIVAAATAAAVARASAPDPSRPIVTCQRNRGSSEPEAGLHIDPGPLLAMRGRYREGVGAVEVRKPDTAPGRAVPPIGGFARQKHPAHVRQPEDAEVGGQHELQARQ